jgi:hypothetical protein
MCSSSSPTGPPAANSPDEPQLVSLLYYPIFRRSHLHRQASPRPQRRERPLAAKGGRVGEK